MKEKLKLAENEIPIFTDFNETLVPFADEYNNSKFMYTEGRDLEVGSVKIMVTRALKEFEKRTGLKPVLFVVTNASVNAIDGNDAPGIHQDMHMTFFDHNSDDYERAKMVYENSCEKYFRALIYKENDSYFEIHPLASSLDEMFVKSPFSEKAKAIRLDPSHKKLETIERIMTDIGGDRSKIKYAIFAGDSIKDDYPMKMVGGMDGACKIFIRPGKVQKAKPSVMAEFCSSMGISFSKVLTKKGKVKTQFDEEWVNGLPENERHALLNYHGGDHVILTNPNTRGFAEGIYNAIEIINAQQKAQGNQFGG